MIKTRPTSPAIPKTTPDRTLFCRKLVWGGPATELLDGEASLAIAVTVCVGVTVTGGSEDVEGGMVSVVLEVVLSEVDSEAELDVEVDAWLTEDELDWETDEELES